MRARLGAFLAELTKWNRAYNLTATRDAGEIVTRHILDSLALLPVLPPRIESSASRSSADGLRLLDVGSGAGFPAVPLALARADLQVTALDSNGKKARFLRHVQRTLEIPNLVVAESRVEQFAPEKPFDVIVSRAFASLGEFTRLTKNLLAPSGEWVAMKGKLDSQELAGIPDDVEIREKRRLRVPGLDEDRHAIVAAIKSPGPAK